MHASKRRLAARGAALITWCLVAARIAVAAPENPFDDSFWTRWGDGRAEISSYDLEFPRYGESRSGTAVAIFVTETFSEDVRVKADPGVHSKDDEFPVLKLNLVQDFPTGVYDYNLMTSVFLGLTSRWGRPIGSVAKVSFSSQEWCGHVYHQLSPDATGVTGELHSYFDGEADQRTRHKYPADGQFEDALWMWARGFATPYLEPGESREIDLLGSLEIARLSHRPIGWKRTTLSRGADASTASVPAGTFTVETFVARVTGGATWTFLVESGGDRRIVEWQRSDGAHGKLVATERVAYWKMNGSEYARELSRIGLSPRPPRTP